MNATSRASSEDAAVPPVPQRGLIIASVMLATVIQALDTTIANVALPHMAGGLSASLDQVTWVLTSYIVAAAITTPLTGWATASWGRRTVLLWSVAGFTAASVLCGLSGSLPLLVAARVLQGVCGASLVPLSQAVMLQITPKSEQGAAMAVWGMGVMVGPIIGPSLGGWLTDSYDWRWVFFINLPVGALAFAGIWRSVPAQPRARPPVFDLFGFATLSLAIGALQLMLDRGQDNDWFGSTETWAEAIVFGVALACFAVHTAFTPAERSFLDHRLLGNRNFVTGLVFISIVGLVLYATRALLPPMLQSVMGYPVVTIGLVTAPGGLGTMIGMQLVGRLIGKVDRRLLLLTGLGVTAVSLWQMSAYEPSLAEWDIVWPGFIQGLGLGLVFVPLSTLTFSTVPATALAQGAGIYSLLRNLGSSIGISLVQTLLVRDTQVVHASLVERLDLGAVPPGNGGLDLGSAAGLQWLNGEITRQATMVAYLDDFRLMLVLTLLMMPLLWWIRPPKTALGGTAAATAAAVD